ncbi:hypothetical protein [Sphingomonas aerolata]|uniref:hypothetical protein n=1 Tax=Sphingomonas aerolata TaxID=185951 RepID=UPI002FE0CD3D
MRTLGLMLAVSLPAMAAAQQAPAPVPATEGAQTDGAAAEPEDSVEGEEIVVTGSRKLPGSVVGDIPPDQTLGQADIRSYGVSSVSDLLAELSPQTTSGRGSGARRWCCSTGGASRAFPKSATSRPRRSSASRSCPRRSR